MKNNFLKFLLLFNIFSCLSQEYTIPNIKFEGNSGSLNFVKILGLKDENSLIISMGYSGYWQNGTISKFIVYQNDGKILKFNVYFKNDLENPKVIKKKLSKRKYKLYWNLLNESFIDNRFKIEKDKLNINEKPEKGRMMTETIIADGTNYIFNMFKNDNYLMYSSYSPEYYIEHKYPGFEERKKLVTLITKFEEFYDKN